MSNLSDTTKQIVSQLDAVCAGRDQVEVTYLGCSLVEVSTVTHSMTLYLPTLAIAFEDIMSSTVMPAVASVITAILNRSFAGTIQVDVDGGEDSIAPALAQAYYYEAACGIFTFYKEDNGSCGSIESGDLYNWLLAYRLQPASGLVAQLMHQFDLV